MIAGTPVLSIIGVGGSPVLSNGGRVIRFIQQCSDRTWRMGIYGDGH